MAGPQDLQRPIYSETGWFPESGITLRSSAASWPWAG